MGISAAGVTKLFNLHYWQVPKPLNLPNYWISEHKYECALRSGLASLKSLMSLTATGLPSGGGLLGVHRDTLEHLDITSGAFFSKYQVNSFLREEWPALKTLKASVLSPSPLPRFTPLPIEEIVLKMPNLETVEFFGCSFNVKSRSALGKLPHLRELSLSPALDFDLDYVDPEESTAIVSHLSGLSKPDSLCRDKLEALNLGLISSLDISVFSSISEFKN